MGPEPTVLPQFSSEPRNGEVTVDGIRSQIGSSTSSELASSGRSPTVTETALRAALDALRVDRKELARRKRLGGLTVQEEDQLAEIVEAMDRLERRLESKPRGESLLEQLDELSKRVSMTYASVLAHGRTTTK